MWPPDAPVRIGNPWHGQANGAVLKRPGFTDIPFAAPQSQGCDIIRNPVVPSLAPLADDDAQGREWRDYALLSGWERRLYGVALGQNRWIYCDPNGTPWLVAATLSVDTGAQTAIARVTLAARFGLIGAGDQTVNRDLASLVIDYSAYYDDWGGDLAPTGAMVSQNEDGSAAYLNLYTEHDEPGLYDFQIGRYDCGVSTQDLGQYLKLRAVLHCALTGTGSTTDGQIGDGISCAVDVYRTAAAIEAEATSDYSYVETGMQADPPSPIITTANQGAEYTRNGHSETAIENRYPIAYWYAGTNTVAASLRYIETAVGDVAWHFTRFAEETDEDEIVHYRWEQTQGDSQRDVIVRVLVGTSTIDQMWHSANSLESSVTVTGIYARWITMIGPGLVNMQGGDPETPHQNTLIADSTASKYGATRDDSPAVGLIDYQPATGQWSAPWHWWV